jgi:hypothetical protein
VAGDAGIRVSRIARAFVDASAPHVYDNQDRGIAGEVYDLPYAQELPNAGALGSSQILIEQNAGPAREELRPRFREAWRRYLEEDKR